MNSITEQIKKFLQGTGNMPPVGFVVEVLRPKKGLQYHAGFDTLESAKGFIKQMQKKNSKWRMSILAMYRWVEEEADNKDDLDVRDMSFADVLPYVQDAYRKFDWKLNEDNCLLPLSVYNNRRLPTGKEKWVTIEDLEFCEWPFKIPTWLPSVVKQQREEVAECSSGEQA